MADKGMVWDLSQLVEDTDPASIREKLDSMVAVAETFREGYRGKICDLDEKGLLKLLEARTPSPSSSRA